MEKEYQEPEERFFQPFPKLRPLDLTCPNCEEAILPEDINIHKGLAKCVACSTAFQLDEDQPLRRKPEVFMPTGIDVLKLSNELDIEISWRRSMGSFFMIFTLMWNGILFAVAAGAILSGDYSMLIFMSIHLAVGLGLIYYTLAVIFNRTNIVVNRYRMTTENRPLKIPFYPDRDIPVGDIQQIFVEKYVASRTNNQPNYAFAVSAILKGNKRLKLVQGVSHADQALYIEQEIENFLQMEDKKVLGEWEGDIID